MFANMWTGTGGVRSAPTSSLVRKPFAANERHEGRERQPPFLDQLIPGDGGTFANTRARQC
jgi:hypothetical protein